MDIPETGQGRKVKIGQFISSLEGPEYDLETGQKVRVVVTRPDDKRYPRRFRFVASDTGSHQLLENTSMVLVPEARNTYEVVLVESGEGWAVMCPALLGCVSQGDSEADALENIKEAITGWLKAESRDVKRRTQKWVDEYQEGGFPVKTVTVTVARVKASASIH